MSYSPTAAATAIANQIAANLATAGLPGPWPNLQNAVVPLLPLQAQIDGYLSGLGYQAQNDVAGTAQSNATASYTNVFASWSPTIPLAKTYLLHVDLSCFMMPALDTVFFQLLVDGSAPGGQPANAMSFFFNVATVHERISFRIPVAFTAGAHTLQLQWKTTAIGTATTNTNDCRCFTLEG